MKFLPYTVDFYGKINIFDLKAVKDVEIFYIFAFNNIEINRVRLQNEYRRGLTVES